MNETTTYFHKIGTVNVDKNKGEGSILFSNSFFLALRSKNSGERAGRHFGLIGVLIGGWLDSRKAKAAPPQYLEHPDLAGLDEKLRLKLQKTDMIAFMPLAGGFVVTEKFSGFVFTAPDSPPVVYKSLFSKGSIRKYLKQRDIPIVK